MDDKNELQQQSQKSPLTFLPYEPNALFQVEEDNWHSSSNYPAISQQLSKSADHVTILDDANTGLSSAGGVSKRMLAQRSATRLQKHTEDKLGVRRHLPTVPSTRASQRGRATGASVPRTILGEGRLDPFNVLPAENVPETVQELLDHSLVSYWTGLAPGTPLWEIGPVHKAWMNLTRNSPCLFYSVVFAGAQHYDFVHGTSHSLSKSSSLLRLSYKTEAVKLVNNMLSNLTNTVPDELLACIELLAWSGPAKEKEEASRFRSPLAKAQWLGFKGNMAPKLAHVNALVRLVQMKGGLEQIETLGISEILAFSDILCATWFLRAPSFPEIGVPQSLVSSGKHVLDEAATKLTLNIGSGFRMQQPTFLNDTAQKVLNTICEVTVAVDHYHRGGHHAPILCDLVAARNSAQHQLLSIPTLYSQSDLLLQSNIIFEVWRLATLTYSNIVIFPLPPASGINTKLALQLKQRLQVAWISNLDQYFHVLLWAVTLGGISTSCSIDKLWFVNRYAEVSTKLGFVRWSQTQELLSSFLWLDFVCEKEGVELWLRARNLIHLQWDNQGN